MATTQTSDRSRLLTDLSLYVYGTTRLGDGKIPFEERAKVSRAAFDQDRRRIRFAHSFPLVRATVGATSKLENLREFLGAAGNIEPLPEDIVNEIIQLHYRWSDEYDTQAEIWTM